MKPFFNEQGSTLYHGKAEVVLPALAENSVDTVITDPPYGLSFMGKHWDHGVPAADVWASVLRVCKPGAFLLAFGGTRTFHRLACAIEDAGWEIRDTMSWLYGSGFPKSLDISKAIDKAAGAEREVVGLKPSHRPNVIGKNSQSMSAAYTARVSTIPSTGNAHLWSGWGTALKPAWEPIIVAMKPLDGTFAQNAQAWGVAGLNIDGGRIETGGERLQGSTVRSDMRGGNFASGRHRPNPGDIPNYVENALGRWPANVLLDSEAAAQLDEMSGQLSSGKPVGIKAGGGNRNCYGEFGGGIPVTGFGDSGGASRFFYTAKASKSDRGYGNDHPTVKPTDLLKYLCKLTATPTGGVILDPFVGSGTTMVAAREYGRPCIGVEMEEAHCRICVDRLRQKVLFGAA